MAQSKTGKKVSETKAAAKKVVARAPRVSRGPSVVKARTGIPSMLGQAPVYYAFRLEPKSKLHAPVEVWGYKTEHGWTGWVEQHRATQLLPTHWEKARWNELAAIVPHTLQKQGTGQ